MKRRRKDGRASSSSSVGSILFQTLLFIVTAYKFILSLRSGWGQVPIVVLLMRDGTWAFFLLFGIQFPVYLYACITLMFHFC